jgi:hypothetical protein
VFLEKSQVPSPTVMVSELYVAPPADDLSSGVGAMTATTGESAVSQPRLEVGM